MHTYKAKTSKNFNFTIVWQENRVTGQLLAQLTGNVLVTLPSMIELGPFLGFEVKSREPPEI